MFSHSLWESRIWAQPDWVLCSGSHRATVQVSASPQPHWRRGDTLRLSSLGVLAELLSPQLRACAPGCWRLLGLTHRSSAHGHPKHSHARPRQQGRSHGWGRKCRGPAGEHTACSAEVPCRPRRITLVRSARSPLPVHHPSWVLWRL